MSNNKTHWENIYKNNNFKNVSWFQEKPTTISFIDNLNLSKDCKIIDVGAGASYLGKTLIDKGYKNITINDISALSIEISQSHNIHNLKKISFLIGDITNLKLPKKTLNDRKTTFITSDFQKSERDFAFVVNKDTKAQDLINAISSIDQKLISNIKVFDVYEGDNIPNNQKSIAISVTIQSNEKTLNDNDLEKINKLIIKTVEDKTGAKIRS